MTIVQVGFVFEVRSANGLVLGRFSSHAAAQGYIDNPPPPPPPPRRPGPAA